MAPAESQAEITEKRQGDVQFRHRSIYPWLFSLPLAAALVTSIAATFWRVRDDIAMKESVRFIQTKQFQNLLLSSVPMLMTCWFLSSMFDVAFNGLVSWPRAQSFNASCVLANALLYFLFYDEASPIFRSVYNSFLMFAWVVSFVMVFLVVPLLGLIFRNLRESIFKREGSNRQNVKTYLQKVLPSCAVVTFIQLCVFIAAFTNGQTFRTLPYFPRDNIQQTICQHVDALYMKTHCVESTAPFDLFDSMQSARPLLGMATLHCKEDLWADHIGSYRSLFDACRAVHDNRQINHSTYMAVTSLALLFALMFREYLSSIDDQMNVWNWISRARSWESHNSVRGASMSAFRIISAITLAVWGLVGGLCLFLVSFMAVITKATVMWPALSTLLVLCGSAWFGAFILLSFQFRHRRKYQNEDSAEALEEKTKAEQRIAEEKRDNMCSFWFISAEFIMRYAGDSVTLPRFQELREEVTENGALVHVQIPFQDAFNGSFNAKGEFCIVSHRWMELGVPDADGVQFRAIQAHLRAHPHIKFVWYDFWCMPQGYKAPADLVNFKWMLSNINVLYLSLGVVILLDLSYFSRFWTQYVRRERIGDDHNCTNRTCDSELHTISALIYIRSFAACCRSIDCVQSCKYLTRSVLSCLARRRRGSPCRPSRRMDCSLRRETRSESGSFLFTTPMSTM